MKNKNGITLISLVITIVILIILAGVAINLSIGENGIFSKAKYAKEQYKIAGIREELEIAMLDIRSDKIAKNEECTVDTMVAELPNKISDITIGKEGNIAKGTYNGYNFTINENLKLYIEGESLALTAKTEVKEYIGKDANSKYAVKVQLTLESEETIGKVEIENTDGTTTKETVGDKTYSKELEIELDKEYKVNITAENGAKTSKKVYVSSTSEIENVEQFVAFRDSVNSGLTYEGATINLNTDIDLSSVCYRVDGTTENDVIWEPIGNTTAPFKGTFNGNYKTIKNLYINTTNDYQGLFGYGRSATVNKVIIDNNSEIIANSYVGGIIGRAQTESTIEECGNNAKVIGKTCVGGISGSTLNTNIRASYNKAEISGENQVGGISGKHESGIISYCYNNKAIYVTKSNIGGIVGFNHDKGKINNCYNVGSITTSGGYYTGGITGRMRAYGVTAYCYNKGDINNEGTDPHIGGIVGENTSYDGTTNVEERKSTVLYCYNSANVISKGKKVGGIVGNNCDYCEVKNCYVYSRAIVQYNGIDATENICSSTNNYLGKILGNKYLTAIESDNGILDEMPTVYYVVNGLSNGKSEYWSNTNPDEPKLLWEK